MRIILIAALLPPLFLLYRIYTLDRAEREPAGLIVKLFFLGCLSAVCAGLLEQLWGIVMSTLSIRFPSDLTQSLFEYFVVVALSEELMKYVFVRYGTWNSSEFNFRFDGIVYAVTVSLGFAALENIQYAFAYGLVNTLVRAVTSIPAHCVFGIYMGYYYGMARWSANLGRSNASRNYRLKCLAVPILLHGFYDFCATANNYYLLLLFFAYIVVLDILAFRAVRQQADRDVPIR